MFNIEVFWHLFYSFHKIVANMLLRPATKVDIPGVASAAVAAYMDDPQDAYLYPKRGEYPARYLKVKSDIIKHSLDDQTALPIVAVLEPGDEGWDGTPEITAFCIWYRESVRGQNESEKQSSLISSEWSGWKESQNNGSQDVFGKLCGFMLCVLMSRIGIKERILGLDVLDSFRDFINPMIDSSHAKAMAEMCSSDESQRWNKDGYHKPDEYWGILDLRVDPKYQRRGIARSLLQWGLERAGKEGLPVHLSATPAGASLYHSLGFRSVGKWTWRPDQDSDWEIMRWDPPKDAHNSDT